MRGAAERISDTIGWAKPEDVGLSRDRLGRIGTALERDIEAGLLPGAVALVARAGRVVYFKAFGSRDAAGTEPMQLDTIFRIYSMTKPVVSVAAAMLIEEGRLSLGDPLSRFIPGFAAPEVATAGPAGTVDRAPAHRPILIHDLLRHTSGLTYEWLDPGPAGIAYANAEAGNRGRDNAAAAELLAGLPLSSQPGTRWDYGRSTDVLGRVIEIASGETLGAHLERRIFRPLGMGETGFRVPAELAGRVAEAFPTDPESGETVRLLDVLKPMPMESGGGGLASTASDYGRFLHALQNGGSLEGERLLSPATIRWMMSDHLPPGVVAGSDLLPEGYGFGLGFAVRRADGGADAPGTAGDAYWLGLAGTNFWIDPVRQLHAVLMVQAPGRREHYRRLMRQLVYGALID